MSRIVEVLIKARVEVPDGLETRHLRVDTNLDVPLLHQVWEQVDGTVRSSPTTKLFPHVLTVAFSITPERTVSP